MIRKISGAFTGGVIGTIIYSISLWILGFVGLTSWVGTTIKPAFTASWLYQLMIWGGLLMLPLMLPLWKSRIAFRGCIFSLLPSAVMLFWVFPRMRKGLMGTGLGLATPFLVIASSFAAGVVAAFWYKSTAR